MPKGIYLHKPENYPPSRKGTHLTEEHKRKVSERMKGNTWNRGRKHSEESSKLKSLNSARYWLDKERKDVAAKLHGNKNGLGHGVSELARNRIKNLNKGRFGKEHPCWVDEKSRPFYKAIRQFFKYVEWRNFIFTRDNFTCVLCKAKGYIEADHYPVRLIDILRKNSIKTIDQASNCAELWDTNNGRTLCKSCHLKTLSWGKKPR